MMGHPAKMAETTKTDAGKTDKTPNEQASTANAPVKEIGGPNGLEPTRYGDWEKKGRCIDF